MAVALAATAAAPAAGALGAGLALASTTLLHTTNALLAPAAATRPASAHLSATAPAPAAGALNLTGTATAAGALGTRLALACTALLHSIGAHLATAAAPAAGALNLTGPGARSGPTASATSSSKGTSGEEGKIIFIMMGVTGHCQKMNGLLFVYNRNKKKRTTPSSTHPKKSCVETESAP